jgi:hypothetical protein
MTDAPEPSKDDSRSDFELNVSLPTDARFAETARELAVHAARHAGCSEARAHAFGQEVEQVIRGYLEAGGTGANVPFVVRRTTGPVEILVNGRTLSLDP